MFGCLASSMACLDLSVSLSDHSMLDWPEPSQTSPTRTSSSSMVLLPLMVIFCALALASSLGRVTFHLPSSPALAVASLPPKLTVTDSPLSAVPQTTIGLSRWTTMWLAKTDGTVTSADAEDASSATTPQASRTERFMAGPSRREQESGWV